MKITQATLKAIIKEEIAKLAERADKNTGMSGVKDEHDLDDLYAMVRKNTERLDKMGK